MTGYKAKTTNLPLSLNSLSDGTKGRIIPYKNTLPAFMNWEYLNPIPTEELTLNPQLVQNPGWDELY